MQHFGHLLATFWPHFGHMLVDLRPKFVCPNLQIARLTLHWFFHIFCVVSIPFSTSYADTFWYLFLNELDIPPNSIFLLEGAPALFTKREEGPVWKGRLQATGWGVRSESYPGWKRYMPWGWRAGLRTPLQARRPPIVSSCASWGSERDTYRHIKAD